MTDTGPGAVVPLSPDGHARAGAVLSQAFLDDPLWTAIFSNSAKRPRLLSLMFTGLIKANVAAHGVVEITPDIGGVAVWLPPNRTIGPWAMVRSGFALPRFMMSVPREGRRRMMPMFRQLDERRKALMPDPHWYLAAVGVSPERQGDGLGTTMVRAGMARADRESAAVYLETETEDNVRFYQHLGFDLLEEISVTGLDLPVWLMARRPSAGP